MNSKMTPSENSKNNIVRIVPVKSQKLLSLFIHLPRLLYKSFPEYVPPLDKEQKGNLDPKHSSFFRYGVARYFLAFRNGKPVGRISAQIDPNALREWKKPIGLFGALDSIDDQDVVNVLVDAASAWLKKMGMEKIRGPYTLTANAELGMMIEGQMAPPMIAMPWHPKYLLPLVENTGLQKVMDVMSYQMQLNQQAIAAHKIPSGLKIGKGSLGNITTRKLDMHHIEQDGEILRQLYNDAWRDNWGFVPLTKIEMAFLIKELKPIFKPENYVLVEQNQKPVAVAMVVPNIYDLMQHDVGPAPSLLGWAKLAFRITTHRFRSARVILLGISHSLKGTALGALMPALVIEELFNRGKILPYRMIELGWILETNKPMRNLIERITPTPCKTYRIFEKDL